jgi:hypothetical protein
MPKTADGYEIEVGDAIWVRSNIIDHNLHPTYAVVGKIVSEYKVEYETPDTDGYVGVRAGASYHLKENAYWPKTEE